LTEYTPARQLRSSNTSLLQQPRNSIHIARRALWSCSHSLEQSPHWHSFCRFIQNFRSLLRTHSYRLAFN